jgi:ketosteroid isomerase-like protein
MPISKNIQTVLDILQDEVNGDISAALEKMTADYTMTWVDVGIDGTKLFPTTQIDVEKDMKVAYVIKNRQYDIRNIAESENLVIVELIESYPDPETGKEYRTPLVLVLEMKDGKIQTGRHYLDPRISMKQLTKEEVENAYKKSRGSKVIIK